jgi:hypothetical protein
MISLRKMFALLALVTALAAVGASSALADDGASVYVGPDGSCTITAFGGFYSGNVMLVQTPSGNVMQQCTTKLVWGTPVSNTENLKFVGLKLVITPSGVANLSIHI